MDIPLKLPFEVIGVLFLLRKAGFEAFMVGGAVRDLLQRSIINATQVTPLDFQPIVDYDFTTNARPDQIQSVFPTNFYENKFGTVSVPHQDLLDQLSSLTTLPSESLATELKRWAAKQETETKIIDLAQASKLHQSLADASVQSVQTKKDPIHPLEITTFRTDGQYHDFRRPESVAWGNSLQEDLARRDFTINSLAISVTDDFLTNAIEHPQALFELKSSDYVLHDPFHGLKDLLEERIRTVGIPQDRFKEDALRMLRAVRFSSQLGATVEPDTLAAISLNSDLLKFVSLERIRDEFLKILASPRAKEGLEMLQQTHLLVTFMPELLLAQGVHQSGHHTTDVWTHSLDSLANCPNPDPIVRLAALIHDIGKPATFQDNGGQITFYNHEVVGARMAVAIGHRLRLAKSEVDRLFILVRYHMFHYQPHNTDAAVRRFMRKVGLNYVDDILDVREGDRLGSGANKTSWRLEEFKQRMIEQLNQPLDVTDLAINGTDLINHCQLSPGPKIGRILAQLFDEVMENPELNSRETLLARAMILKDV